MIIVLLERTDPSSSEASGSCGGGGKLANSTPSKRATSACSVLQSRGRVLLFVQVPQCIRQCFGLQNPEGKKVNILKTKRSVEVDTNSLQFIL